MKGTKNWLKEAEDKLFIFFIQLPFPISLHFNIGFCRSAHDKAAGGLIMLVVGLSFSVKSCL